MICETRAQLFAPGKKIPHKWTKKPAPILTSPCRERPNMVTCMTDPVLSASHVHVLLMFVVESCMFSDSFSQAFAVSAFPFCVNRSF